jgi:hypothetical protein
MAFYPTDVQIWPVSPHVLDPVRFALHLAVHLLAQYGHLTGVFVTVEQLCWARIGTTAAAKGATDKAEAAATEHNKHAFWRVGAEKPFVEVELTREGEGAVAQVAPGLRDLLGAQNLALFLRPFRWVHTHTNAPSLPPSNWMVFLWRAFGSTRVDGIGIREFRAGRVHDAGGGGQSDLQHVRGVEVRIFGHGGALAA